jgi:hypothetical protein
MMPFANEAFGCRFKATAFDDKIGYELTLVRSMNKKRIPCTPTDNIWRHFAISLLRHAGRVQEALPPHPDPLPHEDVVEREFSLSTSSRREL